MKNLDKYLSLLNEEVDGLLLTSRYSRHYGAEFDIAEGVAIVTKAGCRYFTDSRYIESAEKGLKGFEVLEVNRENNYVKRLNDAIADFGVSVLGYEEAYLTVAELMGYEKNLHAQLKPFNNQIYTDTLGANSAVVTSILVKAIDNHNFWLKARHVLELPFIYAARNRRIVK